MPRYPVDIEDASEASLFQIGAGAQCPPTDLLMPAVEGTLPPELRARTQWHVDRCRVCKVLVEALASMEFEPTPSEKQRIDRRVGARGSGGRRAWAASRAAAAALFLAATAALLLPDLYLSAPLPVVRRVAADRRLPPVEHVLALRPPEIELPPAALVLRGGSIDPYIDRLANALAPFRRGQYSRAAVELSAVARRHPREPHARFYAGAARLMNGDAAGAIPDLERASRLAVSDPPLSESASWYLAVALERTAGSEAALPVLAGLCAESRGRNPNACQALHDIARATVTGR